MSREEIDLSTDSERNSDMIARTLLAGCGLLLASYGPASADTLTAKVIAWDAAARTITLDDFSKFADLPKEAPVPSDLRINDVVTIDWDATEDGYQTINSITIIDRELSRRLPPQSDKRS
jgi:hypothetical protein